MLERFPALIWRCRHKETRFLQDAEFLAEVHVPQACCGVAFASGGQIARADVFDQPATLQKLWPKLLRAYALDALDATLR